MMTTGMATIAGTVYVLYASILASVAPDVAGHLLVASLISAPAAITIALVMVPGDVTSVNQLAEIPKDEATGSMDAVTRGTESGLRLFLNI